MTQITFVVMRWGGGGGGGGRCGQLASHDEFRAIAVYYSTSMVSHDEFCAIAVYY